MDTQSPSAATHCELGCQVKKRKRYPAPFPPDEQDSISYLTAVVRGKFKPSGLLAENNMIVTEILEAARESSHVGKTVKLQ